MILEPTKDILQLASPVIDLIQGDPEVYKKKLAHIDFKKVQAALDFILNNPNLSSADKASLLSNDWRILYRERPPTPEEFLTRKYIGEMADNIYDRIRTPFIEFFDPTKPYRNAVLFPHIGFGKSTLSSLINLYITTHLALMRNPKKLFGVAASSILCFLLCSFSLTKAQETLLDPLMEILEGSEFFKRMRTKEDMIKQEREFQNESSIDRLFWTTSSRNGASALQFSNNLQYKLRSDPNTILGLTVVCGTLTELSFFREAGKSEHFILQFYTDMRMRVDSRMKGHYWGRTILDSSPNNLESAVDQFCWYEAEKDPKNMVVKGSRWLHAPEEFILDKTFPVFLGSNGRPPAVLHSAEGYDSQDILYVPYAKDSDMEGIFRSNVRKALKDIGGIPQSDMDRLFYDDYKVEEIFDPHLKNIMQPIRADSRMTPAGLIFDQIKDELFVKNGNSYRFYYKPNLPRVLHVDASISGDMTAIGMAHVERKNDKIGSSVDALKDLIYVVDFIIPISPFGARINMDALREFVIDLVSKGGISIAAASYDGFQSESSLQHLERYGLEMEKLSVDETMDPYLSLASIIEQGNLKCGRSIVLKNNLKSLRVTKRKNSNTLKIDHLPGDIINPLGADLNWETGRLGLFAKDGSDAVCGAVELAKRYLAFDPASLSQKWDTENLVVTPEKIQASKVKTIEAMNFKIPELMG